MQRKLGQGGSAQVWLVSTKRGEQYALKCFAAAGVAMAVGHSFGQHPGLRRELRVLKNFQHKHLIGLHDVVKLTADWSGMTALLMDYAPGGSLADLLAVRHRLSVGETITILTPIFQVLDYLHSHGIQHGDISAGNILFSVTGEPLLADLGLAHWRGERSQLPREGTEGFIDPVRRQTLFEPAAADVYALSALGWWCLSGQSPGQRRRLAALPSNVPARLAEALRSGLAAEPALRPDAANLASEIFATAAALPVDLIAAVHPSVLPQLLTRRRVRRSAWSKQVSIAEQPSRTGPWRFRFPGSRAAGWWLSFRGGRVLLRPFAQLLSSVMLVFVLLFGLSHGVGEDAATTAARAAHSEPGAAQNTQQKAVPRPQLGVDTGGSDAKLLVPSASAQSPAELLAALCRLRAEAFRSGQLKLLDDIDAPGSVALQNDRLSLAALLQQRQLLDGFSISTTTLAQQHNAVGQLIITAKVRFSPYSVRAVAGRVIRHNTAQEQTLRFLLVAHRAHWLISEIHSI